MQQAIFKYDLLHSLQQSCFRGFEWFHRRTVLVICHERDLLDRD